MLERKRDFQLPTTFNINLLCKSIILTRSWPNLEGVESTRVSHSDGYGMGIKLATLPVGVGRRESIGTAAAVERPKVEHLSTFT